MGCKTTHALQEALGGLLGSIFGGFWPRFWLHFRFEVGAPCKDVKNAKIAVSPRRESNFQGSGALKNDEKMLQNRLSKRSSLQERLEEPLGVDFGSILEPSWAYVGLENCLESTFKRMLKLQHVLK